MLILELRDPKRKAWQEIGRLQAGENGSVSHNPQAGKREIYRFRCLGEQSVVERSVAGADVEVGPLRAISTIGFDEVARLNAENPTVEMWLKTDRMPSPQRIRFRHA